MRYNLQGWLTEQKNDLFEMKLHYYDPAKPGTEASYTGNITEWDWTHKGSDADNTANSYAFTYDQLSRLTDTRHFIDGQESNQFVERGLDYDRNGNIKTLKRTSAGTLEDDFTYTYDGNKLVRLDNTGTKDPGTYNYSYDPNGNTTTDGLKSLKLRYNYLNLVGEVTAAPDTTDLKATYSWLADGTKAGVKNGSGTNGFEYLGSLVYHYDGNGNLQLESAAFGAGRILANHGSQTSYTPNYFLTDHLGSPRVILNGTDSPERNNYQPFGMRWVSDQVQAAANRYLYNGKGSQADLGLDALDFGARMYNPRLGSNGWMAVDPLAEIDYANTPYSYCGSNPIKYIDTNGREKIIAFDRSDPRNTTLIPMAENYRDDNSIHIFAHGESGGFMVHMYSDNGEPKPPVAVDSPEKFETFLSEYSVTWQSREHGKHVTVVLHSCETGRNNNGIESIAQRISRKLKNITIIAPDEKLAVADKRYGEMGPYRKPKEGKQTTHNLGTPGSWRYYRDGLYLFRLFNKASVPMNFESDYGIYPIYTPTASIGAVTIEIDVIPEKIMQ